MWRTARNGLVAGALAAGLGSGPALACSCAFPQSPAQHLKISDVVFKGRVLRSTGDISRAATTFRVEATLKGNAAGELTVEHTVLGAACGLTFATGETTLVFAYRSRGKLWTSSCSQPRFSEAEYRAALSR